MVGVENDGISLFSKAPKKKKKKAAARDLSARARHAAIPEDGDTHREAGQDATAALERIGGQAPQTRQAVDADNHNSTAAADTSGRAAEHEQTVTFRSLGISEWLDR